MRKLAILIIVVLVAVGGWWYASPWWTLRQLRAASEARDAQRVSEYVDYPALRTSLKAGLRPYIAAEVAREPDQGLGRLGRAVAATALDPVIDAAVSPEAVAAMFARQQKLAADRAGKAAPTTTAGDDPVIDRQGFDTFRVRQKTQAGFSLVFHRHGLGWKLAGVELPRPPGG